MWTCPKCGESHEDQFDSCWQCAGANQPPPQITELGLLSPVISLASLIGACSWIPLFVHSPRHAAAYCGPGGALLGVIVSTISIWAFFQCPWRQWAAKSLTLLLLIPSLAIGVITVGSFLIHALGI